MRDRLIELLNKQSCPSPVICDKNCKYAHLETCYAERVADHLLANGVIVPPCKVGDTVYVIVETSCENIDLLHTVCEFYTERHENLCTLPKGKCPYKYRINKYSVDQTNILHFSANFGKTVFLTREEAEQALQEGK